MSPQEWDCFLNDANEPANIRCIEDLFANLITSIVALSGLALFVMLVIGGFTYLTAGADPEKAAKAQQTMFWAVAGIVMMIISYIILVVIDQFTGVNILDFTIYIAPS